MWREVDRHVLAAAGFAKPLLDLRRVSVRAHAVRVDPVRDLGFVAFGCGVVNMFLFFFDI